MQRVTSQRETSLKDHDALLCAVAREVRAQVARAAVGPVNGDGAMIWPQIAEIMTRLTGLGLDRKKVSDRCRRLRRDGADLDALADRATPEEYRQTVLDVLGAQFPAPLSVAPEETSITFPDLKRKAEAGWGLDFLDTISEVQDTMRRLDTQQPVAHAVIDTDLPVGVVFPGDFHLGGRGTDHRLLKQDMLMWRSLGDAVKVAGMGDYSEQFTGKMAKIGLSQHVLTNDMQIETVMDVFCTALAGQWLVMVEGNHDSWAGAELARYVMRMAQRLGIPFLGKGGELFLTVGQVEYKLALWHRYPGASALNKGNNQRRVRIDHNGADVVALAHLHNAYVEFSQTGERNHVGLRCGAYKTIDEHSRDAAGNVIADTRVPMVVFNPKERDMLYYEDYRKGIPELLRLRREWHDFPAYAVTPERLRVLQRA